MPEDSSTAPDHAHACADGRHPTPPSVPDHELLRRIGQGAYGEVWLARNVVGTLRAVKVVYRDAFTDARPYEREFQGIQKFEPLSRTHEGFVDILQIGLNEQAGYFFYVMELADAAEPRVESKNELRVERSAPAAEPRVESELRVERSAATAASLPQLSTQISLNSYSPRTLASDLKSLGRLPFAQCLRTALALADALEHLHQHGLIHRDIKPSNIIFVNGTAKLADIGLVTETGAGKSWVGTEGFMPPEGPGTAQGDVYSLGKVLYEISTGKDRQRFPEPLTALADLSDQADWLEFNELVTKACEGDPKRRYASAADLRGDLALLLGGKSVRRLRRIERLWARAKYIALAAAVLAAVAVTWFYFQARLIRQVRQRLLLEQIQQKRLSARREGWSTQAWAQVTEAARLGPSPDVRDEAAATLAGLDAHLRWHKNSPGSSVAFDDGGTRLVVGGYAGEQYTIGTRIFDLTGEVIHDSLEPARGPVAWPANQPPLQFIHKGDFAFELRDVEADRPLASFNVPTPAKLTNCWENPSLALASEGSRVAAAGIFENGRGRVAAWDAAGGAPVLDQFVHEPSALGFTSDGQFLAIGSYEGQIEVWSVRDNRREFALDSGTNAVRCIAFARDPRPLETGPAIGGWTLASGSDGALVTLWDLRARQRRAFCRGLAYEVYSLAFNPDGTILATGGRLATQLWDTATGERVLHLSPSRVRGISFSADGRMLASANEFVLGAGAGPSILLWDMESGRAIQTLRGLPIRVTRVCFSTNGTLAAAVADNWQVAVWDLRSGRRLWVLQGPHGFTADNFALAFSHDNRWLAACAGIEARQWDVATGRLVGSWQFPPGLADRLAFARSGRVILLRSEATNRELTAIRADLTLARPRSALVRELALPNNVLNEITVTNYNYRVHDAAITTDGCFVVINGSHVAGAVSNNTVSVFDVVARTQLWSRPKLVGGEFVPIDPTGRFVCVGFSTNKQAYLLDLLSGHTNRAMVMPSAIGPGARTWCLYSEQSVERPGLDLFETGLPAERVRLALGVSRNSLPPQFSADGSLLAWGNEDGTVAVCHIQTIQQRLAKIGLGW